MHELAVCQELISQVNSLVVEHGADHVDSITLGIGPLSGVERDLLVRAFPLAAAGSKAERAELHIEEVPVRVKCSSCNKTSSALANRLLCAYCGDWKTELVSGDDMLLISVELNKTNTTKPSVATVVSN